MTRRREYSRWLHRQPRPSPGWREAGAVTAGFVGGLVVGALVWSVQMSRYRRELFSTNRFRRFAALGYLAGQPGVHSARLLAEYVRWETHPTLRRRGERLLRRLKVYLE